MQFFVTVGVIVTALIVVGIGYFLICVALGCYDRYKLHHGDYRYDLNAKSRTMSIWYAFIGWFPLLVLVWMVSEFLDLLATI